MPPHQPQKKSPEQGPCFDGARRLVAQTICGPREPCIPTPTYPIVKNTDEFVHRYVPERTFTSEHPMKILVISDYSPRETQGIAVTLKEVVEALYRRYEDKGDVRVRVHACEGAEELAQSRNYARASSAGESIHVRPYAHPAREWYRTPHVSEANWYNEESLISKPYPTVAPTVELKDSLQLPWSESNSNEPGPDIIHWLLPAGNLHAVSSHVLPHTPVYFSHQLDTEGCLGVIDGSALHVRFSHVFGRTVYPWSGFVERTFMRQLGQLFLRRVAQDWPGAINGGPYAGFLDDKEMHCMRRKLSRPCARFVSRPEDVVVPTAVKNEFVQGRTHKICDRRAGYRTSLVEELRITDLFYEGSRTINRDALGKELEEKVLVLMVNRISREKNIELAINVFIESANLRRSAHLIIIGNGPGTQEESLLQMIIAADANDQLSPPLKTCITFLGRRPNGDIPRYYQGCDLFLTTSVAESFGLTVAEALCCDTPTLMSDKVLAFRKMYGSEEFLKKNMFDNESTASLQDRLETVVTQLTTVNGASGGNPSMPEVIERNGLRLRQGTRNAANSLIAKGVFFPSWNEVVGQLLEQYKYAVAFKRSTMDWRNGHSKVDYIRARGNAAMTFLPRKLFGRPLLSAPPCVAKHEQESDGPSDGENSPFSTKEMLLEKGGEQIVPLNSA